MQHISGCVRRCLEDYDMVAPGDTIAVALSGGKDSLTLLCALAELRRYFPIPYTLNAITLDMGIPGMDFSPLSEFCKTLDVPHFIIPTHIYHLLFEERHEKNPCSLCAKLRRGALSRVLGERGIQKIALGHHYDDAVETFLLSLLFEGRLSCFQPVTYLSRSGITQIRPLLYVGEPTIQAAAKRLALPVVRNPCPANGYTKRQEVKELLSNWEERYPGLRARIFGSIQRLPLTGWAPKEKRRRPLP